MYVYLAWISKEMHMNHAMSVYLVPNAYVEMQSCISAMMW